MAEVAVPRKLGGHPEGGACAPVGGGEGADAVDDVVRGFAKSCYDFGRAAVDLGHVLDLGALMVKLVDADGVDQMKVDFAVGCL